MLAGKKIVITGAGHGIGRAAARLAAERGARPVLLGRDADALEEAALGIGGGAAGHAADVTDTAALAGTFEAIGPFDHLLTCAFESYHAPFAELDDGRVRDFVETKLWGQYNCVRAGLGTLSENGSVVLVSGFLNRKGEPGTVPFAIANAAVEGLARALAADLAPVRVNALSPGQIDTYGDRMDPDEHRRYRSNVAESLPVSRPGEPEDAAHAALFLMENTFVNGEVLDVDGGRR